MTKDEKILKKVGKLLLVYGVSEEEKKKFLADVQDTKNDEEDEPIEEDKVEEEKVEETEETKSTEDGDKPTEDGEVEEKEEVKAEEPIEPQDKGDEPKEENEVEDKQEEVVKEDEKPVEEPAVEDEPKVEEEHEKELKETIDGLVARISSLEEIVSKLAVPADDEFGTSPANQSAESYKETEMERYNKMRTGH